MRNALLIITIGIAGLICGFEKGVDYTEPTNTEIVEEVEQETDEITDFVNKVEYVLRDIEKDLKHSEVVFRQFINKVDERLDDLQG